MASESFSSLLVGLSAGTLPDAELDRAIEAARGVPAAAAALACALLLRFRRRPREEDLAEGLELFTNAPADAEWIPTLHARLGVAMRVVARSARDAPTADEAAEALEEAITATDPAAPWLAAWQHELAYTLLLRDELEPGGGHLDRAIDALAASVAGTEDDDEALRTRRWDLAEARLTRWLRAPDPDTLDALGAELGPESADRLWGRMFELGVNRVSAGERSELHALIVLGERLLARTDPASPYRRSRMTNLGLVHLVHDDVERAIELAREALAAGGEHVDAAELVLGTALTRVGERDKSAAHEAVALLGPLCERLAREDPNYERATRQLIAACVAALPDAPLATLGEIAAPLRSACAALRDAEPEGTAALAQMVLGLLRTALDEDEISDRTLEVAREALAEAIVLAPDPELVLDHARASRLRLQRRWQAIVDARRPAHPADPLTLANVRESLTSATPAQAAAIGHSALKGDDHELAVAAFERAAAAGHAESAFNAGVLHALAGRRREAIGAYERAIELGDGDAASNLGLLYEQHARGQLADATFRRGLAMGHGRSGMLLGLRLEARGQTDEAEAAYRAGLAAGEGDAGLTLGAYLWRAGRLDEAVAAFEQGIDLASPGSALALGDLWWARGALGLSVAAYSAAALLGVGPSSGAVEALHAAGLPLDPLLLALADRANTGDQQATTALGDALLAADRPEEAISVYEFALEQGFAEAGFHLGNLHLAADRLDDAERAFAAGAELGSRNAAFNLADLHRRAGRGPETRQALTRAIELGDGQAAANLAALEIEAGRHEAAATALEQAIALGYTDAAVQLGALRADQGRFDDARHAWRRVPNNLQAATMLADVLRRVGERLPRAEEAERAFRHGAALEAEGESDDAELWYALAATTGHTRAAIAQARLLAARGDAWAALDALAAPVIYDVEEAHREAQRLLAEVDAEQAATWRNVVAKLRARPHQDDMWRPANG